MQTRISDFDPLISPPYLLISLVFIWSMYDLLSTIVVVPRTDVDDAT